MYIKVVGAAPGRTIDVYSYGGVAICDWLPRMREIARRKIDAVVLAFGGNNLSPCMKDPRSGKGYAGLALLAKYTTDADEAMRVLAPTGANVWFVTDPISTVNPWARATFLDVWKGVVARWPKARIVDAGAAVMDGDKFTPTLPCLPSEGPAQGCTNGRITVRAPDGGHFCPGGMENHDPVTALCTVYMSGALRYATALIDPVIRSLGT
jgi:hypothetical protein